MSLIHIARGGNRAGLEHKNNWWLSRLECSLRHLHRAAFGAVQVKAYRNHHLTKMLLLNIGLDIDLALLDQRITYENNF